MENTETPKKNPHLMEADYKRYDHPNAPGGKFYLPVYKYQGVPFVVSSLYFKTATDAKKRAERIIARWCRLYDAWLTVESEKSGVLLNG